ncbi:adenylate/guanylate cyclase domain-containing protein [Mesorhizobium sp.]|uniref:adenylate/guanylate cyclase domain-containing protein n=1 Tax=Mesorhizobium sp. TaxID=1871066 RepID=UPI0025FC93E4|nr:adenylate/guanylate cyclase domain-containing protein [Mesorhizobium sp.]
MALEQPGDTFTIRLAFASMSIEHRRLQWLQCNGFRFGQPPKKLLPISRIRVGGDAQLQPGESFRVFFRELLQHMCELPRAAGGRAVFAVPLFVAVVATHTGPVISGVVGRRKFTFDIWGDAVNTAALMEENGAPGRINVSETVAGNVRTLFELEPRGVIETKHGRRLEMFFLTG